MQVEGRPAHSGVAARGRAQRHPRGRAPDPRGRGADGLRQGRHHHSGHDEGGTAANVVPAASRASASTCASLGGGREAFAADHPRAQAARSRRQDHRYRRDEPAALREERSRHARCYETARAIAAAMAASCGDAPLDGRRQRRQFHRRARRAHAGGLGIDGDGAHTLWEHGLISSILPRTRLMEDAATLA